MILDRASGKSRSPHWARFRRFTGWMAVLSAALALAALGYLRAFGPPMPWQGRLAAGAAVFFTTLLTATLMGLLFASARGGHDLDLEVDPEDATHG